MTIVLTDASLISQRSCTATFTISLVDWFGQVCGTASADVVISQTDGGFADHTFPTLRTCGASADVVAGSITQRGNSRFGVFWTEPTRIPQPAPAGSAHDPFGRWNAPGHVGLRVFVSGYAVDRDATRSSGTAPISIETTVDGHRHSVVPANQDAASHGFLPPNDDSRHGYATSVDFGPAGGRHALCVIALNTGPGHNTTLGCTAVDLNPRPYGYLDRTYNVDGGTSVTFVGWAIDPNTANPIRTDLYVDGKLRARVRASENRPDVARYHLGAHHGFSGSAGGLRAGHHTACAYALNFAGGRNTKLGCVTT